MVQNQEQPVGKITFSILIALSLSHCLNDLLQSVLSASYPLFKDDLGLSFAQIGLITLVYQLSASVFQPTRWTMVLMVSALVGRSAARREAISRAPTG